MATAADTALRGTPAPPVWRRLLLATSLGWILGIVLGVGLIVLAESFGIGNIQSPLVLGVALGLSSQQYRALRPVLTQRRVRWMLLSCLGLASPFIVADAATLAGRSMPYSVTSFVIVGGVVASLFQWGILRNVVQRASGWLIASPIGFIAAASTIVLNERVIPKTPGILGALQYIAVILAGGVLLGISTALAASRFEPSRIRAENSPSGSVRDHPQ